jgi:uncharacterized DUF497 family protein
VSNLKFEWDEKKNIANWRKHGISSDEARTAFLYRQREDIIGIISARKAARDEIELYHWWQR